MKLLTPLLTCRAQRRSSFLWFSVQRFYFLSSIGKKTNGFSFSCQLRSIDRAGLLRKTEVETQVLQKSLLLSISAVYCVHSIGDSMCLPPLLKAILYTCSLKLHFQYFFCLACNYHHSQDHFMLSNVFYSQRSSMSQWTEHRFDHYGNTSFSGFQSSLGFPELFLISYVAKCD